MTAHHDDEPAPMASIALRILAGLLILGPIVFAGAWFTVPAIVLLATGGRW